MAQLAVAAAGAAIGSFFGAPQVGWLVGSLIGAALFSGGQQQKVEGPRLGDLQVQASTYGMGIPQVFGSMRIAGNVIWARPLIEKRSKSSAGKGGGGQTVVSYAYFATFAVAFAKGPVDAIRRVWADGKLIVDLSETSVQGKSFRYGEHIYRLHLGTETQAPDPVIEMHEGAGNAPGYRGLVVHHLRRAAAQGLRQPHPQHHRRGRRRRQHRASQPARRPVVPGRRQLGQGRLAARYRAALHLQPLVRLAAQGQPGHRPGRLPRGGGRQSSRGRSALGRAGLAGHARRLRLCDRSGLGRRVRRRERLQPHDLRPPRCGHAAAQELVSAGAVQPRRHARLRGPLPRLQIGPGRACGDHRLREPDRRAGRDRLGLRWPPEHRVRSRSGQEAPLRDQREQHRLPGLGLLVRRLVRAARALAPGGRPRPARGLVARRHRLRPRLGAGDRRRLERPLRLRSGDAARSSRACSAATAAGASSMPGRTSRRSMASSGCRTPARSGGSTRSP